MSGIETPKNRAPIDPYRTFRFILKLDGRPVAGFSKVSSLNKPTTVVTHRSGGGSPLRMPGQTEYETITLERGVAHDSAFELWANKVWEHPHSAMDKPHSSVDSGDVALTDFRKDLVLEFYNEAGQRVLTYNLRRCWPSEFSAMPELDASSNAVAIQSLVLQNEGWDRDGEVKTG